METPARVVWARGTASSTVCPKSLITPQSMAWLEEYFVRRKLGQRGIDGLGAREVEAFLMLEHELSGEHAGRNIGEQATAPAPRGKLGR